MIVCTIMYRLLQPGVISLRVRDAKKINPSIRIALGSDEVLPQQV